MNPILTTDSYKTSHFLQYPPRTERVSAYIEARGYQVPFIHNPEVAFFGLQHLLKSNMLFNTNILQCYVDWAEKFITEHGLPFNKKGWEIIINEHGGRLPIEIMAVAEGTPVPPGHVLCQVINTDTRLPWLTSYVETALLRAIWYGSTVATLSREAKKIIKIYLKMTADNLDGLPFKLHDFGARGVSSGESAEIGGMAHLVNFMGTDTMEAIWAAQYFYNTDKMLGFSIPAAEHSTITSWGPDNEAEAYGNMLDKFAQPGKLVAVVSDSYDIYNACDKIWGQDLKDKVLVSGATVVIRPDSGIPERVVPKVLDILGQRFGTTTNSKGYKVLPSAIRVIQGDGINLRSIPCILDAVMLAGFSTDNLAMGMGGGLLQQINRDSLRFAMKANAIQIGGVWHDVWKQPKTDMGKSSKKGRLALSRDAHGNYRTIALNDCPDSQNLLRPVWRNGELLIDDTFEQIRERAKL